jgi:hypothetical protein
MWRQRTIARSDDGAILGDSLAAALQPVEAIRTSARLLSGTLAGIVASLGAVSQADPKRDLPDYDGRGNQDARRESGASWALWVPRVVLSPLYAANEYLLRRPLGALVRRAERDRWADTFVQLFTFGEGGHSVLVPTASFELGRLPSVGIYYAGDDVLARGNTLRLELATWGPRRIHAVAADRYAIDDASRIEARLELSRAADHLFLGLGPEVTDDTRARYGVQRIESTVRYRRWLPGAARIDAAAGVQRTGFIAGDCCGDPSLDARVAREELMAPPGHRDAYATAFGRAELTVDTRRPHPEPGSGVYLHAHGTPSVDLHRARSWLRYGAVVGGALDLTGHRRTLRLQVALDFVDPIAGGADPAIPFTEYPVLGGERMPGFVAGWLTGRSTATAQLGYTWPVWLGLDAQARFTLGNAYGARLTGLAPGALRMSGDLGFTTSSARDQGVELVVGVGSETFDQGAEVTSLRVMLGSRRGF